MATQYPSFQPYQALNDAVTGLDKMLTGASANIQNNISGLPSAGPTQRANAYFGASSGMPGSDFVRNRGFDLYGQQAESYKQRGFDDFLSLLKGASGTLAPTTGEQLQNQQFNQNLQQRQGEFNYNANQARLAEYKKDQAERFKRQSPREGNSFTGGGDWRGWADSFGGKHTGQSPFS